MRKFGKESASPEDKGGSRDVSGNKGWLKNHWCVLSLCVIVIAAFLLRTVFAYGVSADGNFALSGGSSAQYHLHVIESILNGSYSLTDSAVNYPVGGLLVYPPLVDFIAAAVAMVLSAFGMGATEAASAALGSINPVIGALTCIPVFLVGKELFDRRVGVVAALVFAFLALPISTSVFSSGTEYALAAFLVAFMSYFLVKMVHALDEDERDRKKVLLNAVIAGVFLALAALTWNGFRIILVMLIVFMIAHIVVDRFRGRDFTDVLVGTSVVMLIGVAVSALYYIPAGLWDAVFSGPVLITIVAIAFAFAFKAVQAKPWIFTIPALVVVFLVFLAVLYFAAPGLFTDFVSGNSMYSSSIMGDLVSNRVSMSNVAAYYGWLTMWLPICMAIYQFYLYAKGDRSSTRLFTVVWMLVLFLCAWTNYANAAVIGVVFAVGSASVIVTVLERADLKSWYASMKTAGFPGLLRKMIKPFPFASVLIVALLVVVPNFTFAIDAGMSNNADSDHFFSGNTQYTIKTGDSYPLGDVWESVEDQPKDGAIVTWIDYSYDAVAQGGFDSVTDAFGGGASAAAQIYMGDGSAGATAAMLMRIIMSNGIDDLASAFGGHSAIYSKIKEYIDDPAKAIEEIKSNPDAYGNVRTDITDENAVYLASVNCILEGMNEVELIGVYNAACDATGDRISYVLVDGSMLPIAYGDNDNFSTIAYFADYSVDGYGAATEFYSYNTYYGYTQYKDAIYGTFLWRALIGPSASQAGEFSNSYSYLAALASSDGKDGSVIAHPGYGLTGYEVEVWRVMYNADDKATGSSEGWEYMDGEEAIALQKEQGGLINYLSSIVLLKYTGTSSASTASGNVTDASGDAVNGATVSVYEYDEASRQFVLFSEGTTRNGHYDVAVPAGDYRIEISMGSIVMASSNGPVGDVTISSATLNGNVVVGESVYTGKMKLELTGQNGGMEYSVDSVNGAIAVNGILPDTYDYKLLDETGSAVATGTVSVYPGDNTGFKATPKTYTITVTGKDVYGNTVDHGIAIATNTETGDQFSMAFDEDGKAKITVLPGSYTISAGEGYVSMNTSVSNASSGNRTSNLTVYESTSVRVNGDTPIVISAGSFSTVSYNGVVEIPVGMTSENGTVLFTAYGVSGDTVYHGVYTGGSTLSLASASGVSVTGTLKNGDDTSSGTVQFIASNGATYSAAVDSEGRFNIILPTGEYTVAANNGSDKVSVSKRTISSDTDLGDISLENGRKITVTLKFDMGSSKNLPFATAFMTFTYNDVAYTMYGMTGTDGAAAFYIPDDVKSTVTFANTNGVLNNQYFDCANLKKEINEGTSNNNQTLTIQAYDVDDDEQDENLVKTIDFTAPYAMKLDGSDNDYDLNRGDHARLSPDSYDVTIDGSEGVYFDGEIDVLPGMSGSDIVIDYVNVTTVTIRSGENDTVTIDTTDGAYHRASTDGVYYFENGYVYYVTSTATVDGKDKIAYRSIDLTASGSAVTIDMTATQDAMTVTGFVGITADGTMDVSFDGNDMVVDVKDGVYEMTLPANVTSVDYYVEVTATIDDEDCTFATDGRLTDLQDDAVRNIAAISAEPSEPGEEEDVPDFTATISSGRFANGSGEATVTINNNTDSAVTYLISAGPSWSLTGAYSVTVGANGSGNVTVSGVYDASRVAPGSDGFTVIVKDINGAHTETVDVLVGGDSSGTAGMDILNASEGEFNDKISAYEYMYAITLVNNDAGAKTVRVTANAPSGWYVTLVDETGAIVTENGGSFTVYGLQTTVVYVKFMPANGVTEGMTIPDLSATVSYGSGTETVTAEPVDASVTNDSMDASGTDIFNERSGIPTGIWILLAFGIILLIAIFWLGSKRGVFSRKN